MGGAKEMTDDMEAYNSAAMDDYNDKALDKCEGCGRTFLPESLVKHQKMCLKGKPGKGRSKSPAVGKGGFGGNSGGMGGGGIGGSSSSGGLGSSGKKRKTREPIGLICYICGMKFGSASLNIHLP